MTDRLTTEEIQDLRAKSAAATKGPWNSNWLMVDAGESEPDCLTGVAECFDAQDADLIATMRNTLDRLLDELLEHREREAAEIAVANALGGLKWTEANPQRPPVIDVRMPMPKETDR